MPTIAQLTAVIEAQDQFSSTFNRLEAATSAILSGALADLIRRAGEVGFAFDAMREQAEIAFTNLLGSGEEARNFLDELAAFAAQTPFEFPDLLRAAQRFKAMGFESHQVIPILKSVGDAVAALGGNAEQVNRVTTALIQMRAKGKVSAEEMMQLAEAGIPAWEILARKIGTDIPTAMKRAEKGGVDANTAIAALVEGMNERFGGMMEQQARTFQGLVSTVRDSARFIIGDALQPMFENARKGLEKLVDILPTVAGFIRNLNPEILAVAGTFVAVFGATGVVIAGAAAVVAFLGGPLTLAILGVSATVAAMAAAVALNIDRLSEIFGAFSDAARIEFADVAAVLGATVDAFQLLARGAITVLDVIVTNVRQAAFLISNTFRALAAHIKDFVVGIVTGNLPQLVSGIQTLQQSLADIGRAFGAEFSALRHRVARDLELMGEHFQGKFAEQFYDAALQAGDSVNTFRADIDRLVADLRKSAAAAGNKANALGRAGGAAKAAAKETRELTGAVNDYLRAAGNQLRVTEEFIKGRSAEARALIEQARAYFTLQEALDQLNLGRVSRGLAALSDDIKVHGGVLGVPIA
ncbi:MAG TPA: tape measure protein, partial [Blastocatellia bacterium]|nr:tape measure protein [Blastocatellia bacterium]